MLLDNIKKNIERESQISKEIVKFYSRLESMNNAAASGKIIDLHEKQIIEKTIMTLFEQARILNNALPDMVQAISFYKNLDADKKEKNTLNKNLLDVKYKDSIINKEQKITIKKEEESKFLENLSKQEASANKVLKTKNESAYSFGAYINISNRLFRNFSDKLVEKGYFNFVRNDLRRITSPFVLSSYLSVCFFSSLLSLGVSIIAFILILLLKFGFLLAISAFFLIPILTFLLFLFYPSMQRKALEREINQELPFLTIYMSAISTSGIEPSKIFNVVSASKDYPTTRREIKKLNNYINFYGYDIVTALKMISKNCPSEKLAQLFDGLSTTITSGGMLNEYLNKHSETLLFDYRLEREKYTRLAETFMNIYISIVIAAPMIMMMLFILIGFTGGGGGLLGNPTNMSIITVLLISLLNIGFLMFLNSKQPKF